MDIPEEIRPKLVDLELSEEMTDILTAQDFPSFGQDAPSIYRVPVFLRQWAKDSYYPKLIFIGPLHSGNEELRHFEPLKWKYLHDLINRNPEMNRMESYVDAIWREEERARKEYSEEIDLTKRDLVQMLVLDGCFLVELLIKQESGFVSSTWKETQWNLQLLRRDFLLLENQIPFFVLVTLYNLSRVEFRSRPPSSFLDLALRFISKGQVNERELGMLESGVRHLLHLDYLCRLQGFYPNINPDYDYQTSTLHRISRAFQTGFCFLLSRVLLGKRPKSDDSRSKKDPRGIPTATELKNVGVSFRRREQEDRKCLLNVSFTDGRLEIPGLSLKEKKISSFRNLIALEQSWEDMENHFTAFFNFMDWIIDTPSDVAILIDRKIIKNRPASDEDVAWMFNNICNGTYFYGNHYLANLYKRVNTYYNSDRARLNALVNEWRAALDEKYGYRPLSIFFFVAAIILLLMTVVGTGATIWQTIYTVRSYHKQFN